MSAYNVGNSVSNLGDHKVTPRAFSAALLSAVVLWTPAVLAEGQVNAHGFESSLRRKVVRNAQDPERFSIYERMAYYGVPAVSLAVVDNCRIVTARAYGTANPQGGETTPSTLFQAGSVSKVVAAVGALKLVEERKLSLDADIGEYLTGWNLPRPSFANVPVTLRQLLSHTAGLGVEGFKGYAIDDAMPSLKQVLDGEPPANTQAVRLESAPGAGWRYSGGGFVVTQMLVEQASGRGFADYMRQRVLVPAGMESSTYAQPLPPDLTPRAASGTLADGSPIRGGWRVYPEQAAAGLWTTPRDLARFSIVLVEALRGVSPAVVTQATVLGMLQPQSERWGLGVELSKPGEPRSFSHTGAPVGYRTLWLMFPDSCQGATIMTNADEGMALAYEVARAIADGYHWPDPMPSEVVAFAAPSRQQVGRFLGTYQLADFPAERFTVSQAADGALYWSRVGRGRRELQSTNRDELVAPDSGMRLRAVDYEQSTGVASTLEVRFPGGVNLARRVRTGL